MTPDTCAAGGGRGRGGVGAVAVSLLALGTLFTGCSIISAVHKAAKTIEGNKTTIDGFTSKIQSGPTKPFEVTYVTTGSSPATIVYAVDPPSGVTFKDTTTTTGTTSTGSVGSVDIIVNSSGEYVCSPPATAGSPTTCEKLGKASAAQENQIFGFYTPSHWITFLKDFSLAAGFAGDKVTSSVLTVNGFAMSCVDFVATGVPGTSTICTTSEGILGYVKVASDSTSFEIKSYSSSPDPSLFELPPGAKVTTVTTTPPPTT
jgi:hypothetical protein